MELEWRDRVAKLCCPRWPCKNPETPGRPDTLWGKSSQPDVLLSLSWSPGLKAPHRRQLDADSPAADPVARSGPVENIGRSCHPWSDLLRDWITKYKEGARTLL